jgi:hypothetical protein
MQSDLINYLHFGSALRDRESTNWGHLAGVKHKTEVLTTIRAHDTANADLIELVRSYGPCRSRKVDVDRLKLEINKSISYQIQFRALGCRGFSYRVEGDIRFSMPLAKRISLRHALLTGEELFYPPRIKAYLRRVCNNHYYSGGFPSIGFALGTKLRDEWFVFILQSDLAFHSPSYVRDHFRGWARVLLSSVIEKARHRAKAIYISRAVDALRTCHPCFPTPQRVPASWEVTYDATADFFGMELVRLKRPIDMQLYSRQKPVLVEHFYRLKIRSSN